MSDARTLTVSVVTPEGAAYEGEAAHVVAPAFDGSHRGRGMAAE